LPTRKTIVCALIGLFAYLFVSKGVLTPIASRSLRIIYLSSLNAADARVIWIQDGEWNYCLADFLRLLEIEAWLLKVLVSLQSFVGYDVICRGT